MRIEARRAVDAAWDRIWSDGISNPIRAIEVIALALLALRLRSEEHDASFSGWEPEAVAQKVEDALEIDLSEAARQLDAGTFRAVLRGLAEAGITEDVDGPGDSLEHALSRLSTAKRFGQFRTPAHIAAFMTRCLPVQSEAVILDPAAGTAGFLISALREFGNRRVRVVGDEIDPTMAAIANANMALHGAPDRVRRCDSLRNVGEEADFVLANPPFGARIGDDRELDFKISSRKSELLFLELISRRLRPAGIAAVVIPVGVLSNSDGGSQSTRTLLLNEGEVLAVVELPGGVFRPYTDVKTAIIFWRKGTSTKSVRMFKAASDGFSLDDRRKPTEQNDLLRLQEQVQATLIGVEIECEAVDVDRSQIDRNDLVLLPSRYITEAFDRVGSRHLDELVGEMLTELEATIQELKEVV
jgi:type I restriction enzyme M protein